MIRGLIAAAATIVFASFSAAGEQPIDVFEAIQGTWAVSEEANTFKPIKPNCRTPSEIITISADHKTYHEAVLQLTADIIGQGDKAIAITYSKQSDRAPRQLDDNGKPIIWVLQMNDRNTFHWRRYDTPKSRTVKRVRCPAAINS